MKRNTSKKYLDGRAKYVGELAVLIYEPIIPGPQSNSLANYETAQAAWKRGMERAIGKLPRLMRWHGIDPSAEGALAELAIRLALTHVPGMRIEHTPRRGRLPTWKAGLGVELVREVEALRRKRNMSIERAIIELNKSDKWKSYTKQNLLVRHRESRCTLRRPINRYNSLNSLAAFLDDRPERRKI